jgi:nucleoside-diphosphate-sugar epimerase
MPDSLDFARKPVLVLGASGFIGQRVVAALAVSETYRPVAASRHTKTAGIAMDATDAAAMATALQGADRVVNCVAGSSATMITATRVLCDAARRSPPARIVHLSSMAVYGAATGVVREDHAPIPPLSGYGEAKRTCETILAKYGRDGGDAVILRPACVFGPGSVQWTTRLARLLESRRLGDLGAAGDGCCNLAFIDDVVATIITALDAPDAANRTFNLSGNAGMTWNDFLVRFARALNATPVKRIAPRTLKLETKVLAAPLKIAGMTLGSLVPEAITPSLAALFRQDIRIDNSAAVSVLSMPQTPVPTIISAAVQWLERQASSRRSPIRQQEPVRS